MISFRYELTGVGWSECELWIHGKRAQLTASYLSDALGDLVSAVVSILEGNEEAQASFMEEPGEYRWIFKKTSEEDMIIRVLEYEDWVDHYKIPESNGQLLLEAAVNIRDFCVIFCQELNRVKERYGLLGYKRQWHEDEFPLSSHERLKELLGKPTI